MSDEGKRSAPDLVLVFEESIQPGLTVVSSAEYGFEYSDEDMSEGNVDIENQYYNSKGTIFAKNTTCTKTHGAPS